MNEKLNEKIGLIYETIGNLENIMNDLNPNQLVNIEKTIEILTTLSIEIESNNCGMECLHENEGE